ncbi:MAG: class I SAM-dependent methyltransferase [Bacteroidota bacterium]
MATLNSVIGPGFEGLTSSSQSWATAMATASYRTLRIEIDAVEHAARIRKTDAAPGTCHGSMTNCHSLSTEAHVVPHYAAALRHLLAVSYHTHDAELHPNVQQRFTDHKGSRSGARRRPLIGQHLELTNADDVSRANLPQLKENRFWSTGGAVELRLHRIHAYPAKFPAFIPTKALEFAETEGLRVRRVADIFCGCGTVAFEARRVDINFWGCDINPVATLIARTKSGSFDAKLLMQYYAGIAARKERASAKINLAAAATERLDYWYSADQFRRLARLLNAINQTVPARSRYRSFFHCAFSNILKATSRWLTKSIKPQVDPRKKPADPWDTFAKQFEMMKSAFEQSAVESSNGAQILTANFLTLDNAPRDIDLLITSPPYVTSYEYADLHQLSSLWLGYASDYRDLRNGSIGSTQHEIEFNREIKRLNTIGNQVVFGLFDRDRSIARSTAKYFLDMQAVSRRCHDLLRRKSLALFVIGNTEYKGVRIDNAAHLAESLLRGGFSSVRVAKRKMSGKILTPYRDSIGQFSRRNDGRHVYGEEFILIAAK